MNIQHLEALTPSQLLFNASEILAQSGCSSCQFEAEYLLREALGVTRAELFLHGDTPVSSEKVARFQAMIQRRQCFEPLQYIVGEVEFWSREFQVSPAVLIPRQETEFVLEKVLTLVHKHIHCCRRILDMGTGSGVIADVLAGELSCQVLAVDISPEALDIARGNIYNHQLTDKVQFLCSDFFSAINRQEEFDLIVSNPPYVAEVERNEIHPEVTQFEPTTALFAGIDGLSCYQRLIPESFQYLRPGGWLCLEIGASQGAAITELLRSSGYHSPGIINDYSGRPRFACGKKAGSN